MPDGGGTSARWNATPAAIALRVWPLTPLSLLTSLESRLSLGGDFYVHSLKRPLVALPLVQRRQQLPRCPRG